MTTTAMTVPLAALELVGDESQQWLQKNNQLSPEELCRLFRGDIFTLNALMGVRTRQKPVVLAKQAISFARRYPSLGANACWYFWHTIDSFV